MCETRVPARLAGGTNDPRLLRRLPWTPPQFAASTLIGALAWAVFFSIALLYIPAIYVYHSVTHRQWSLKWVLLLPAVAAAPLVAVMIEAPDLPARGVEFRILLAAITLPAPVAVAELVAWSIRRRWRPVVMWLAAAVVTTAILAAVVLLVAQSVQRTALQPGERYAWDGWWLIWLHGGYLTACLLTVWLVLRAVARGVVGGLRRMRLAKGAV